VKTSEVKLDYFPNGAVSSLNASAEDRSAQVISGVVATAVKVIPLLAAAAAPVDGKPAEACSPAVLAARKVVTEKTPIMEATVKLVDSRTEEVNALNRKIASMGPNVDERTKAALSKAYDALIAAQGDLSDIQAVLEKALKVITYVETARWPEHGDMADGEAQIPRAVLSRWGADNNPNTRKEVAVFFKLAGIGLVARDLSKGDVVDPQYGVPYRQPVLGRLTVCTGGPCGTDNLPIAEKIGDVLQLGHVYYLPCQSRAFTFHLLFFCHDGRRPADVDGHCQKAASAEGLSGAAKDTATQLGSLQETLAGAKTKRLEAQTAALKAQADYAAAAAALQPDPGKPDKEETAASRQARTCWMRNALSSRHRLRSARPWPKQERRVHNGLREEGQPMAGQSPGVPKETLKAFPSFKNPSRQRREQAGHCGHGGLTPPPPGGSGGLALERGGAHSGIPGEVQHLHVVCGRVCRGESPLSQESHPDSTRAGFIHSCLLNLDCNQGVSAEDALDAARRTESRMDFRTTILFRRIIAPRATCMR